MLQKRRGRRRSVGGQSDTSFIQSSQVQSVEVVLTGDGRRRAAEAHISTSEKSVSNEMKVGLLFLFFAAFFECAREFSFVFYSTFNCSRR